MFLKAGYKRLLRKKLRTHCPFDLQGDVHILLQKAHGIVTPLSDLFFSVRVPRPFFFDNFLLNRCIQQTRKGRKTLPKENLRFYLAEGGCHLILYYPDPYLIAPRFLITS